MKSSLFSQNQTVTPENYLNLKMKPSDTSSSKIQYKTRRTSPIALTLCMFLISAVYLLGSPCSVVYITLKKFIRLCGLGLGLADRIGGSCRLILAHRPHIIMGDGIPTALNRCRISDRRTEIPGVLSASPLLLEEVL